MKKALLGCMVILVIIGILFFSFGTMESYSEFAIGDIKQEFLGYISDQWYQGEVSIATNELPQWCLPYISTDDEILFFSIPPGHRARLGLFVDFTQYEYLYEKRNMITGTLKDTASERYYRPNGQVTVLPITETPTATFDHRLIKIDK